MVTIAPKVVFGYGAGAVISEVSGPVSESTLDDVLQALEFAMALPDTDSVVVTVLGARFTDPAWVRFLSTMAGIAHRSTRPVRLVVPDAVRERAEVRLRPTGVRVHCDLRAALDPVGADAAPGR